MLLREQHQTCARIVKPEAPAGGSVGLGSGCDEFRKVFRMKIRTWAGAVLVAAGLCGVAAVPAAAAAPVAGTDRAQVLERLERPATSMRELRQQIDLQLELTPGGRQTAVNEISYDGGTFVVTYPMPYAAAGVPNCPSGWFCFYDGTQYNGARGKLSDCGWQNLEDYDWIDRTESVHNNTEWAVKYHNHMDYGDPSNGHSFDWHLFTNNAYSAIASVPFRNSADHVSRRCY